MDVLDPGLSITDVQHMRNFITWKRRLNSNRQILKMFSIEGILELLMLAIL